MSNPHGSFIWYELMTTDPLAARRFYGEVVGWNIDDKPSGPTGEAHDYRMIAAADGLVGGVFRLTDDMCQAGAAPAWMGYIGVDDVDATTAAIQADGGNAMVPPTDIPGVGRFAMLTDAQGAVFYVMRGTSNEASTVFSPQKAGHGAWNELHAADGAAALAFYGKHFGWTKLHAVDMGPEGEYLLFGGHGQNLGGMFTDKRFPRPAWLYYFRVDGIEAAAERVKKAGGQVVHGPVEVPGGGWIVNAVDPQGAHFALTGTR